AGFNHARVDPEDARVRQRRADEDGVLGALELEVGDVPRLPREEARIFLAQHTLANKAGHTRTSTTAALLPTQPPPAPPFRAPPARRSRGCGARRSSRSRPPSRRPA